MGLGRVDAAGQVVQCHLQDVLAHLLRVVGVVGQGLCVGDHHIDLIVLAGVLQAHALLQGADIVAHMQTSGRAVARQNHFFHGFLLLFCRRSPPSQALTRQLSQRESPWQEGKRLLFAAWLSPWESWHCEAMTERAQAESKQMPLANSFL